MELLDIEVTGRKALTLPWQEVQVMPLGDVQIGSEGVARKKLRNYINWGLEQKNVYFLGMGDYIDILSPSNRRAWQSAALYESVRQSMEDKAQEYVENFLELVKGSEGRWLGIVEGHHFFEFEDGTTSDTRIAHGLGCAFLGTCAFVRLRFRGDGHKGRLACTLWVHHGAGGGLTPHSPLTRLLHVMHYFDADIYLIGHQTKKPAVKVPYLYMSSKPPYQLIAKHKILAGTGGFSEGYMQGSQSVSGRAQGGYVEQRMLSPVALGAVLLKIRPVYGDETRGDRLDMNVEI